LVSSLDDKKDINNQLMRMLDLPPPTAAPAAAPAAKLPP